MYSCEIPLFLPLLIARRPAQRIHLQCLLLSQWSVQKYRFHRNFRNLKKIYSQSIKSFCVLLLMCGICSTNGLVSSMFTERIHISTPNKYEYQYVKKPARMTQFQVAVKTHNDAHFALSSSPHDSAEMIEIILGGRQNTRSWISVGKMGEPLVSAATPGILSWDEFRSFWISWRGSVVQVPEI